MRYISNYSVEDVPIGSGGMGKVLKGISPDNRPVAIKEILPQFVTDMEYRSRIESEIRFLTQLNHESVVHVYDHFECDGKLYIVMELVEGMNIEQYVASRGPMRWDEAMGYLVKLLDTLQYVHEKNIVHRDIKPSNIMIRPDGRICLLDFGVAKDVGSNTGGTVFGTVIGTDGYMSPEQAEGLTIDSRSDVYALGCVLYFMLTGRHAYAKMASEHETQYNIKFKPFPRLADADPSIPAKVQAVLDGAVDKNMLKRYQSCREFRDRILKVLPNGTQVNSSITDEIISVSIGRENCDICVGSDNFRVSRHHADVKLKSFTGGQFYVYTDCSANGSVVNGQMLTKGMTVHIPMGQTPEIFLAGDLTCRLDFGEVAKMLRQKYDEAQKNSSVEESPVIESTVNVNLRPAPRRGNGMTFTESVKTCLLKYATFSGRASRGEYWWFQFLNMAVVTSLLLMYVISDFKVEFPGIIVVYSLAVFVPTLAVTLRRLHDTGHGWGALAIGYFGSMVPLVGLAASIWMLVQLAKKGDEMTNEYGPEPA